MLRRIALAAVAGIACAVPVGCATHTCSGYDSTLQQDQLLEQSETLRFGEAQWHRGADWPAERPAPETVRIHGGIL